MAIGGPSIVRALIAPIEWLLGALGVLWFLLWLEE